MDGFPRPADTAEEHALICKLMGAPMEVGSTWSLISYCWYVATSIRATNLMCW